MWLVVLPLAAAAVTVRYDDNACVGGAALFVSVHEANLRSAPGVDAPAVAQLPLGTAVTAVERLADTEVSGRSGAWCMVKLADGRAGAMFSTTLTAHRLQADLDEDGVPEDIFVSYNKDHRLVVGVSDPNGGVGAVDLGVQQDGGGFLDQADVTLPADLGVPLLRVYVAGSEMCGGFSRELYVAWRNGPDGLARGAEVLRGISGADAPVYTHTTFSFKARKKQVVVVETFGESREDGPSAEDITTTTLRFDGLVYHEIARNKRHEGPPRE